MRLFKIIVTACFLVMTGNAFAQQMALTGNRNSFAPDEQFAIEYSGAQKGDCILLYHNVSLLPLKQRGMVTEETGAFNPVGLQPGDYKAVLVGADGVGKMQIFFSVGNYDLPAGKRIVVISDPHVMAPELVENPSNAVYQRVMSQDRKLMPYSYELFSACLDSVRALKPDLLLIVGDMTKDGERASNELVSMCLQQLADEGIPSLVIPGNHDMENIGAIRFTADSYQKAETIGEEEFEAIYQNFGWGVASERDPFSLTYACDLFSGVRFIGIDDCMTPSRGYTRVGDAEYGKVNPNTVDWVLSQADRAKEEGKVVIAAIHHQMLNHYVGQERLMASAATEKGDSIARLFADHGIHVVLTGHMHTPNASRIKGWETENVITEISCASTVTYPVQFRILTLSDDLSTLSVDTRYLRSTANLPDVQQAARDKVESTLSKSISDLVPRYMATFNQMLAAFASEPAFAAVIDDVPQDPEELSAIMEMAFSETMKKVLFTLSEGNEQLKDAQENIFSQLKNDCALACELMFDQQTPDTRAFLAMSMYYYMLENGETLLKSMLSDTSYMGTDLADQTDDLYLRVSLRDNGAGIISTSVDEGSAPCEVYGINGIRLGSDARRLPHGIYIIRQGAKTHKVIL